MDIDPWLQDPSTPPDSRFPVGRRRSLGVVVAVFVAVLGPTADATDLRPAPSTRDVAAPAVERGLPAPVGGEDDTATPSRTVAEPGPDRVALYVGGIAARVRTGDGAAVPGDLFVLMATAGSEAHARLYDETPFTHRFGRHIDTEASNDTARAVIERLLGDEVPARTFTTPPGGGSSTGLPYAIAHLNLVSGGAFTGPVRVAATGRIDDLGYVHPVQAVDEKSAAAGLAVAHVLFTPSPPGHDRLDEHGARFVGELHRVHLSGRPLGEERHLDRYREWGADRPSGMDVVGVRHLGDVAAYLCGAGSAFACEVETAMSDVVTGRGAEPTEPRSTGSTTDRR